MKKLIDFIGEIANINELWTTSTWDPETGNVQSEEGKVNYYYLSPGKYIASTDLEDLEGESADRNGSRGRFDINFWKGYKAAGEAPSKEEMTENRAYVTRQINARKPFFIQGERGWAKSSIIKDVALRKKLNVVTVYLNGADEADIMGTPIPTKYKNDVILNYAPPAWAGYIIDHPEEEFLLFFDELNQASPAVLNRLMPMVEQGTKDLCGVRCDNFFVGAAGNFNEESRGLQDLRDYMPLLDRLGGIHTWNTDEEEWKGVKKYWDRTAKGMDQSLIDTFYSYKDIFGNPRSVKYLIDYVWDSKKNVEANPEEADIYNARDIYTEIMQNVLNDEDMKKSRFKRAEIEKQAKDLAEYVANYIQGLAAKTAATGRGRKKNEMMINKEHQEDIKNAIASGIFEVILENDQDPIATFGISKENVNDVMTFVFAGDGADDYPAEAINAYVDMIIKKGDPEFRYNTVAECKAGEKDVKDIIFWSKDFNG